MSERKKWTKQDHEREVAEAVVASIEGLALHEMRDAPDADLLHRDGFHIGLEVVRAEDERAATLRERFNAASDLIKGELEAQGVQGVFSVYYDLQQMFEDDNKRGWNRTVPKRVATFYKTHGPGRVNAPELTAAGITRIACIDRETAPRTFVRTGWRSTARGGRTLAEIALADKHEKLARYRVENGTYFQQYWLGIASFGPGTVEDGGFSMLRDRRFQTDYDRVLLLNRGSNGRLVGADDITPMPVA